MEFIGLNVLVGKFIYDDCKYSVLSLHLQQIDVKKYRLLRKELPDGRAYGVYDGLVPARYQVLVNHYLKHSHEAWLFNNYDADNFNNQVVFYLTDI